jgi:diguanylate cyclase (GGDEF)-like protein/PAS domain S-box-containing protein
MSAAEALDERACNLLRDIFPAISSTVGKAFFSVLMNHLVDRLDARGAFVARAVADKPGHYEITVAAGQCLLPKGGTIELSPSQQSLLFSQAISPSELNLESILAAAFQDPELRSLLALPLSTADGSPLGMAVLFWQEAEQETQLAASVLLSFKERLGAELERELSAAALREQVHFLQELIDAIPTPIFFKDQNLRYIGGNREFLDALGLKKEEILGRTVHDIAPADFADSYHATDRRLLDAQKIESYQGPMIYADGSLREVIFTKSVFLTPSKAVGGIVGTMFDVTLNKQLEEKAYRLANYDPLTGLPNRTNFLQKLDQILRLAAKEERPVAVLCLDLDKFKAVNDSFGFEACNTMLKVYAERLVAQARGRDVVARTGGDRFAMALYPIAHEEDAALVARRILQIIGEPILLEGGTIHGTGSIGISLYARDGRDAGALLNCADSAMYQAKAHSKNSYQYFCREINAATQEQLALEAAMRRGIDEGEFSLHYQPLIDLFSGTVIGAEALLRWTRGDGSSIPPDRFIPVAEENGLIHPLGQWALREACRQNRAWQEAGYPRIKMAVNISGVQLRRNDFVPLVGSILQETGLRPGDLELELTESSLMENSEGNVLRLHALKALGVSLSIDDFGTGYSSLSYLKRFPLDVLKIDRSFITDVPRGEHDRVITEAIIAMAHRLGLKVLAEGIETADQLLFLKRHRCAMGQGHFFSQPLPAGEFARFLDHHSRLCPRSSTSSGSYDYASA